MRGPEPGHVDASAPCALPPAPDPPLPPAPSAAVRVRAGVVVGAVAAVLAAVAIAFFGVLDHDAVNWDDDHYLPRNERLSPPFDAAKVRWILTDRELFYWHPLSYAVAAAQNAVFGGAPGPRHAVSLALHLVNSALVLALALAVLRRAWPAGSGPADGLRVAGAAAAALLWGVHPLRAEPVAWISEQKELLAAGFCLAAAMAWLRARSGSDGAPARRWTVASHAFALLAVASKPMAVTLPGALLLLDVFPLRRLRSRADAWPLLREKAVLFGICAAALLYSATGPKEQARTASIAARSDPVVRLAVPAWGFAAGLVRTVAPAGLSPVYPYPSRAAVVRDAPRYAGSALLLAAATAAALWGWRRRGVVAPAVAWAAFLGMTLPVSGVRRLASIETADRFAYLPTIPLFLLVGAGVALQLSAVGRPGRILVGSFVLAAAMALGRVAAAQAEVWRDSVSMWTHVRARAAGPVLAASVNLGVLHYDAGRAAVAAGRKEEGERHLREAERLLAEAIAVDAHHPAAHVNLGLVALARRQPHTAEVHFRRAVGLAPRSGSARAWLGLALVEIGRAAEGRRECSLALESGEALPAPLREAAARVAAGGMPPRVGE